MNIIGFMIWNMISHISWNILYDIFCKFSMIISYYENEYDIIIIRMEFDILKFYTVNIHYMEICFFCKDDASIKFDK